MIIRMLTPTLAIVKKPNGGFHLVLETLFSSSSETEEIGSVVKRIPFGGATPLSAIINIFLANANLYAGFKEAFEVFLNEQLRVRLEKANCETSEPLTELLMSLIELQRVIISGPVEIILQEAASYIQEHQEKT